MNDMIREYLDPHRFILQRKVYRYTIQNVRRSKGETLESHGTPLQISEAMNGIYYHEFSTDNLQTCL